jgi:hypothetical protein
VARPRALSAHRPHHLQEHAGAVDHRRVDDLPFAGALTFPQGGEDIGDEEHRAAAGARQVARHRVGLVETMGGGAAGMDGNACVVTILSVWS